MRSRNRGNEKNKSQENSNLVNGHVVMDKFASTDGEQQQDIYGNQSLTRSASGSATLTADRTMSWEEDNNTVVTEQWKGISERDLGLSFILLLLLSWWCCQCHAGRLVV